MGDFTSEKEQKLLESEAEVSNTEDTNADELTFEEISEFSDDDDDSEEEKKPKKKFIGYDKQNKKFFIGKFKIGKKLLIIILVIAILAGICSGLIIKSKNNSAVKVMYTDSPVERRTITNTITGSSSIKPNDSYNVTTIKSGDITSDTFKEGDVVKKGDKLYQFEDSDAQNSLSTAKNALAKAQQAYVDAVKQKAQTVSSNNIGTKSAQNAVTKALNSLNDTKNNQYIQSNSAGKVKELSVKEGDHINAGAAVATLYDDSYMKLRIPFNEVDAESIQTGAAATVSVIGSGDTIYGTVKEKSSSAVSTDAHAKVVYVTVEVTNPGALTTNDYGSAEINGVACANTAQFEYVSEGTITSTASGTLENLNIAVGDSVYSGQKVGYVKYDNQNSTMSNAQLSYNDAVLALEKQVLQNDTFSQDSSIKNAQLALDDAELGIEKAQDAVDDYVVEAPIEGTVVKKNSKAGDTIDSSNATDPLCVIYDLSSVKISIDVDETEIALIKTGQKATVTADAVEGEFEGVVTKVPVDGVNENGVTTYTIEIQIENYGDLLPGMNVDAEIVVEEADNVIAVPVNSVNRGNIVFVKDDGTTHENDVTDIIKGNKDKSGKTDDKKKADDKDDKPQSSGMPVVSVDTPNGDKSDEISVTKESVPTNIDVPDGYRAIQVETGINDTDYIEIKSGLTEKDQVRTLDTESSSANASFGDPNAQDMYVVPNGNMGGMPGGGMSGGGMSGGGMSGGGGMPGGGGMSGGGGMPGGR
ncbi:efflux RND transporter periplasmic adaptor subunit [Hominilimicola sp.]|uniref:efflux RND transporter periplasmic adaptor subunit n=1 Tax=Hominilimicola sp. TaxID=3073571 RepID=UPI00307D0A57